MLKNKYPSIAKASRVQIHHNTVILNLALDQQLVDHELHDHHQSLLNWAIFLSTFFKLSDINYKYRSVLVIPPTKIEGSWCLYLMLFTNNLSVLGSEWMGNSFFLHLVFSSIDSMAFSTLNLFACKKRSLFIFVKNGSISLFSFTNYFSNYASALFSNGEYYCPPPNIFLHCCSGFLWLGTMIYYPGWGRKGTLGEIVKSWFRNIHPFPDEVVSHYKLYTGKKITAYETNRSQSKYSDFFSKSIFFRGFLEEKSLRMTNASRKKK